VNTNRNIKNSDKENWKTSIKETSCKISEKRICYICEKYQLFKQRYHCKIWDFRGGNYEECHLLGCHQGDKIGKLRTMLAVTSNRSTLMIEGICFSKMSVLTRATRRHIREDGILQIKTSFILTFCNLVQVDTVMYWRVPRSHSTHVLLQMSDNRQVIELVTVLFRQDRIEPCHWNLITRLMSRQVIGWNIKFKAMCS
jgi:hypothetical protein